MAERSWLPFDGDAESRLKRVWRRDALIWIVRSDLTDPWRSVAGDVEEEEEAGRRSVKSENSTTITFREQWTWGVLFGISQDPPDANTRRRPWQPGFVYVDRPGRKVEVPPFAWIGSDVSRGEMTRASFMLYSMKIALEIHKNSPRTP